MIELTKRMDPSGAMADLAAMVLARCDEVAAFSEEPGKVTRTFLGDAMRALHGHVRHWMEQAGMDVRLDAAGNLIGRYAGSGATRPALAIGSHLDTVPDGGKYDGVLGVLSGIAAVQHLAGRRLPFAIDVIAFSEEEGVRYRAPFLGSLAMTGRFDHGLLDRTDRDGISMADAFRRFGLDPARIGDAAYSPDELLAFVEPHIEQGPALDVLGAPLAVVEAIAGQSRIWAEMRGRSGHAGTLPMENRADALAAAAELVIAVERTAQSRAGLRATVGSLFVEPGASNVVPGRARLSIDVRHAIDAKRTAAVARILARAEATAKRRGVSFEIEHQEHRRAVAADPYLSGLLNSAITSTGHFGHCLVSGAGHDAGVMAAIAPMAMLFLRSPGGVSHHPDERVLADDVAVGLAVLVHFIDLLASRTAAGGGLSRPVSTEGAA